MKVLITPQFNRGMLALSKDARTEVSRLFSLVSATSREQLVKSPLLTKLERGKEDIYTLRTRSVRVFCAFDLAGDLLFLDVSEARSPSAAGKGPNEITLFGPHGEPKAYVATSDDNTIYSFHGRPLAYVDENSNVYGFNGRHLGWFEDGIIWDHRGLKVGFTSSACPAFTRFEPFKGFKQFKPFKAFKAFAPFKPFKSLSNSSTDLLTFLEEGAS